MTLTLALLEGCAIVAAVVAAMAIWPLAPDAGGMAGPALLFATGVMVALYYTDGYDVRVASSARRFIARLPRCVLLASAPAVAVGTLFPGAGPAVAATSVVLPPLLVALRAAFFRLVRSRAFAERVLIIGRGPLAARTIEALETEGAGRYVVAGVAGDGGDSGDGEDALQRHPRLGPLTELERIIASTRPDRIVVALEERRRRLPVRPLLESRLAGVAIEDGADLYERLTGKIAIEALTPSSLIFARDFRAAPVARAVSRALSVGAAAIGLVLAAPLFAAIALAIRLESTGPVFFIHERVGWKGRRFRLIKFRTMDASAGPRSEWACDNSHRITRVGYWLRRFRLDELPQFINILRGDMDLVGPRPHPSTNFSLFVTVLRNSPECGEQIPYYSLRSMVRPGITGWAQVRYRYANNLEEEIEKMRYDLFYVKHRSVWLDLRILADTVKTVVGSREAAGVQRRPGLATRPARAGWQLAPQGATPPRSRWSLGRAARAGRTPHHSEVQL
jgi:exopolysaccharide biosynthesis polyprenyl glycosylphosphotransferase